jgi:hypothetical protein
MRNSERGYRSFEDFERNELRRFETPGASVDDMLDAIFGQEANDSGHRPESRSGGAGYSGWEDEDEE